eukprot:g4855.t1
MGCHHSKARKYHYDAPKPHTHHFSHHFLNERAQRRANTGAKTSSRAPARMATSTYKVYTSKTSGFDDSEEVSRMQREIDTLKTNHKLTLEKLETLMSKLDIQDDTGLASSMLFTKAEDMEDAEYDIGQPMDEGSLSDFTLTKDQIAEHKWNHVEISEEYNFDLTQNEGEHIDLLDGT